MKVAFHFDEYRLQGGEAAAKALLKSLRAATKHANTKIFIGTLLFSHAASKSSQIGDTTMERVDMKLRAAIIDEWARSLPLRWHALRPAAFDTAHDGKVWAISLESIDATTASLIDKAMEEAFKGVYLGALEVDESVASHLGIYLLCAFGRIDGESAVAFWDGLSADSKMPYALEWLKHASFDPVAFESLEGRYSIFDRDHGAEQVHRNAHSRQWMRELFDGIIDHAMPRLADGAPEIPEMLWSALRSFRETTVDEQSSHVALTCRRIFDHVANALFPATDPTPEGIGLGPTQYKNRLIQYLKEQRATDTESALIVATMEATWAELNNLDKLSHKGVHANIGRMQARRCLLRTLLLLDDLIAVRQSPLATRIRHDTDLIRKMARRSLDDPKA